MPGTRDPGHSALSTYEKEKEIEPEPPLVGVEPAVPPLEALVGAEVTVTVYPAGGPAAALAQ